jgi:hypothetical protein
LQFGVGTSAGLASIGAATALLSLHHAALLEPTLAATALVIAVPLVGSVVLTLTIAGFRRIHRRRRQLASSASAAAAFEARLRATMSELCPHGWRAHVTLFDSADELPPDAPGNERARVALDWAELDADSSEPAIVRRVWAPTVLAAMEAMIADRRTDETLERIERAAVWPD